MNTVLSPPVADVEMSEQEAEYMAWLQEKVAASLADPRPAIPHAEVDRRMTERLNELRQRRSL